MYGAVLRFKLLCYSPGPKQSSLLLDIYSCINRLLKILVAKNHNYFIYLWSSWSAWTGLSWMIFLLTSPRVTHTSWSAGGLTGELASAGQPFPAPRGLTLQLASLALHSNSMFNEDRGKWQGPLRLMLKSTQCVFHFILLFKQVIRPAQIQKVRK